MQKFKPLSYMFSFEQLSAVIFSLWGASAFRRDFTTNMTPQRRAFKTEMLNAPLFPGPERAVNTNDYVHKCYIGRLNCITFFIQCSFTFNDKTDKTVSGTNTEEPPKNTTRHIHKHKLACLTLCDRCGARTHTRLCGETIV